MDVASMMIYIATQGITPGPSNLMAFYTSATYGVKGAWGYISGTITGFFVKMILCGLLNLALAAYVPQVLPVLKWVGGAYLLYLAYHIISSGRKEMKAAAERHAEGQESGEAVPQPQKGVSATFLGGILLQVLNMKSWLMCLTVFSIFIMPYTTAWQTLLLWACITTLVMVSCTLVWAFGGHFIKRQYQRHRQVFDIGMALLLVYCAISAVL